MDSRARRKYNGFSSLRSLLKKANKLRGPEITSFKSAERGHNLDQGRVHQDEFLPAAHVFL